MQICPRERGSTIAGAAFCGGGGMNKASVLTARSSIIILSATRAMIVCLGGYTLINPGLLAEGVLIGSCSFG